MFLETLLLTVIIVLVLFVRKKKNGLRGPSVVPGLLPASEEGGNMADIAATESFPQVR